MVGNIHLMILLLLSESNYIYILGYWGHVSLMCVCHVSCIIFIIMSSHGSMFDYFISFLRSEVWLVIQSSIIRAVNLSYFNISLPFIMFVVFSVYVTVTPEEDNIPVLTPQKVFTTLALLSFVRVTLFPVVQGSLYFSEARVAFKRIKVRAHY